MIYNYIYIYIYKYCCPKYKPSSLCCLGFNWKGPIAPSFCGQTCRRTGLTVPPNEQSIIGVIYVFDCSSTLRHPDTLARTGPHLWVRVHTWHKNMHRIQKAISENLHMMKTFDTWRPSCLYCYDICIITGQSDCKMGIEMVIMKLVSFPETTDWTLPW